MPIGATLASIQPNVLSVRYNVPMNVSEAARVLGRKGGQSRARRLSGAEKKRIASLGGNARRQSLEMARRIAANFRYAEMFGEFPGVAAVTRLREFAGPLPGIYPRGA